MLQNSAPRSHSPRRISQVQNPENMAREYFGSIKLVACLVRNLTHQIAMPTHVTYTFTHTRRFTRTHTTLLRTVPCCDLKWNATVLGAESVCVEGIVLTWARKTCFEECGNSVPYTHSYLQDTWCMLNTLQLHKMNHSRPAPRVVKASRIIGRGTPSTNDVFPNFSFCLFILWCIEMSSSF